jgi:hypothetical protein
VKDATRDLLVIRGWWDRWDYANIGLATGAPSGFWALDVDTRHGGDETLRELEAKHGSLPSTVTSITGSKGAHYLFQIPVGVTIPSRVGVATGIDIRGDGGFIVAPPSVHATGSRYTWDLAHRPEDEVPADPPSWLLELVTNGGAERGPAAPLPDVLPQGQRRAAMLSLAGSMRRRGCGETAILAALRAENTARCSPALEECELLAIGRDVATRYAPSGSARAASPALNVGSPGPKLRTRRAADVKIRPLVWLWPGRLPTAMPSLIFGDPGKGKSAFTVDFVSRLTTGRAWPDGAPNNLPPCSALVINCEDDPEVVLVPRLKLAGADLAKVHLFDALEDEKGKLLPFSLGYCTPVEEYLAAHPDIRVVVLDPWGAFLGGKDGNCNGDVRGLIAPFADLCERKSVALIIVAHPNKDAKQSAMYRLGGSLGLIAACRAAFVVTPDPENAERRFFLAVKSNVGALPPGLAFRVNVAEVEDAGTVARIEWEPDSLPPEITADSVMTTVMDSPELRIEKDEAREWLRESLAEGPKHSKEVLRDAKAAGISNKAIRAVAKTLGVSMPRKGFGSGARYVWKLPDPSRPSCVPHACHAFPVPAAGTHGTHEGKHGLGDGSNGVLTLPNGRERAEI